MLDLLKLESFRMVAGTRSFTRASVELGCSQSTVTAHIQSLEREIGAQLFERGRFSREIVLTDAGRRTLEYAGRLLALAKETSIAIHSQAEPSGPLKICASPLLLAHDLSTVLRRFQVRNPHVPLSLSSFPDPRVLAGSVLNGIADVAFVFDQQITSDRVTTETLAREEVVIVCSPDHDLAQADGPLSLRDLEQHHVVFGDLNCPVRAAFGRAMASAGLRQERTIEAGSIEAAKRCAAAALGFAVVPLFSVEREIAWEELVRLPVRGFDLTLDVQIVRNARGWVSPALRALWAIARPDASVASAA